MDIKVNQAQMVTQVPDTVTTETGDGTFKFTLASAITDAELQAKVDSLLSDITFQGNRIAEHMDIRDMKKYRGLIRVWANASASIILPDLSGPFMMYACDTLSIVTAFCRCSMICSCPKIALNPAIASLVLC